MFFVTVDIIQHKSYKVNRITIDLTFLLKYALIFMKTLDSLLKKYKIYYADRITMNNRISIKSMRADNICLLREVQK